MVQGVANRKYTQPYTSLHVIKNTPDPIRADEPAYIKNFPRFMNMIYKKQTPFHIDLLAHYRPPHQVKSNTPTTMGAPTTLMESIKIVEKTIQSNKPTTIKSQQKQGFKTMAQNQQQELQQENSKNLNQVTALPSDFEHIFHYSETQ